MIAKQSIWVPRLTGAVALRVLVALSGASCLTLAMHSAAAQTASDSATAQALFDRGKKLLTQSKFAEACPAFEESQRIEARSGTALNLADCYERSGRLASAWSTFLEAARLAKVTRNSEREQAARERAAALVPRLSQLVIDAPYAASTPGIEVKRDGEFVGPAQMGLPLPVDAGTHTIAASAPNRKPWRKTVRVPSAAGSAQVSVPDLEQEQPAAGTARDSRDSSALAKGNQGAGSPPQIMTSAQRESSGSHGLSGGVIAGAVVTGVLTAGAVVTSFAYQSKLNEYNQANKNLAGGRAELKTETRTRGILNLALVGGAMVAAGVTVFLWTREPRSDGATSARLELRGFIGPELSGLTLRATL